MEHAGAAMAAAPQKADQVGLETRINIRVTSRHLALLPSCLADRMTPDPLRWVAKFLRRTQQQPRLQPRHPEIEEGAQR